MTVRKMMLIMIVIFRKNLLLAISSQITKEFVVPIFLIT